MRAKNVNDCSPEDGSQKGETGCGREAEDRFPDQVASKPCFVVLKYEYEEKQRTCAGLPVDSHSARDCHVESPRGEKEEILEELLVWLVCYPQDTVVPDSQDLGMIRRQWTVFYTETGPV